MQLLLPLAQYNVTALKKCTYSTDKTQVNQEAQ